ncbi:MAG: hypothetical protein ACOCSG_05425 [Guyparkeria sp.]
MKRLIVAILLLGAFPAFAGDGFEVHLGHLYKNYNGSAEKSAAREDVLAIEQSFDRWRLGVGYQRGVIDRHAPRDLRVEKYHLDAVFSATTDVDWGLSYLVIDDNLAPTDGGQVLGTTLLYRGLAPRLAVKGGYHYSDYDDFGVSQLKVGIIRKVPIDGMALSIAAGAGYQRLHDHGESAYIANAKDRYLAPYLKLGLQRGPWYGNLGLAGRRAFEVTADGRRVAHHAMEFRNSIALQVGRRIGALDIRLGLSHHEAEELPQSNRLQINTVGLSADYRF